MYQRYLAAICALVLFSCGPLWAQAGSNELQSLLITEVSTGTTDSASVEFVEVYNPNDTPYSLTCTDLQYASSIDEEAGPAWKSKIDIEPETHLPARGFGLFVTDTFLEKALEAQEEEDTEINENELRTAKLNQGLVDADRSLRLIEYAVPDTDSDTENEQANCDEEILRVHDTVGWGADAPGFETVPFTWLDEEEQPQSELPRDTSMKRLVNEDSLFIDTDSNSDDFLLSDDPFPQLTIVVDADEDTTDDSETDNDSTEEEPDKSDEESDESNETNDEDTGEEEQPDDQDDKTTYQSVEISELFIDPEQPQTDADDEFVELYNPHGTSVDLSGYMIQAGSNLQYTYELDDVVLEAGEYKAFAAEETSLRLANSGGRAQVLDPNGNIIASLVQWSAAETGESYAQFNGEFLWTDNVTPNAANQEPTPELPEEPPATTGTDNALNSSATTQQSYPTVLLNELVPDPASPQTDSDDEFVELYNPNSFTVDLSDYTIRSGSRGTTTHTISSVSVGPNSYVVFFASDSNLTLSNSGITIELEDPNGTVLDATNYPEAEEGEAWAKTSEGAWQWTTTLTPAAQNTFTQAVSESDISITGTASTGDAEGDVLDAVSRPAVVDATQADYRIIVGAAVLALLYGLYEFRYDLYAYFHKFRRYLSNR